MTLMRSSAACERYGPTNEPWGVRRCPELPAAFAIPAAYGDLIAALLALVALAALRSGVGIPLVWAFNLWGTADLLYESTGHQLAGANACTIVKGSGDLGTQGTGAPTGHF